MGIMKGLIIRSPWIDMILAGRKTWEMRSKPTRVRGRIALIKAGSGAIYGTAELVECLAPLNEGQLRLSVDRHGLPENRVHEALANNWTTPWVLRDLEVFEKPVPYQHPSGAVTWVDLAEDVVPVAGAQRVASVEKANEVQPKRLEQEPGSAPVAVMPRVSDSFLLAPSSSVRRIENDRDLGESEAVHLQHVDITLTLSNVKNNHFSLRTAMSLLPADAIGGNNSSQLGRAVEVQFQPGGTVTTDVDGEKKIFRARGAVREFYERSAMAIGDRVRLTRVGERRYEVSKVEAGNLGGQTSM